MKLIVLLTPLGLLIGCATPPARLAVASPEIETSFPVEPTEKIKIVTYHVQAEKLSPSLQSGFEQAMATLKGQYPVASERLGFN